MISDEELVSKAKSAIRPRKNASAKLIADVGAALVTDSGNVYVGVCFDTHEGSGLCAERAAIASMVTAGESRIIKIVAVWTDGTIISSCGACREWIWQVDKKNWDTEVIIGKNKSVTLRKPLPYHWHNPDSK